METETDRFNIIQQSTGMNKKDFAESLGLSKTYGYQIATGRLKATRQVLEKLSSLYKVNLNWYISGKGPSGLEEDSAVIVLLDQEAAAGQGREVEDYPDRRFFQIPRSFITPHHPDRLLAVHVAGDSMIEAHICDGDIAIFHPGLTEGNGIFVVSVENSLVVKRVDRDPASRTIILISANPAYEPRRFTGPELEEIRIAGKVVACYHRV